MKTREKDLFGDPIETGVATHTKSGIVGIVVYVVLCVLLIVVLLPLFWMVLTSFKVKGTAFRMRFWPDTKLYTPPENQKAFPLPDVKAGERYLHVETHRPDATEVQLVVRPETGKEISYPMRYVRDGVWSATVGPLAFDRVQYGFRVNGENKLQGPLAEHSGKSIPLGKGTVTAAGSSQPLNFVYRTDKGIHATVYGKSNHEYGLLFPGGMSVELTPQKKGEGKIGSVLFEGAFPPRDETQYRLVDRRPFSEAIDTLYTLSNFRQILMSKDFNFGRYFINSVIVAGSAGTLTVLICTLGAFAFGYFHFHYRETLFFLLLSSMLVPGMIYMVPQFAITIKLGLMNTYAGMVVPHLANVFGLFLMRQYVLQIPRDLFAAAEIDGAGDFQILHRIVIPVCIPIMVTLFLIVFVTQWSNFLWQLIINTGDSAVLTLPVGLQQFKGQNANQWEMIMAGACFSILPITVLFFCLQRYFLEGLAAGAVKE